MKRASARAPSRVLGLDLARGLAVLGLGVTAAEAWSLRAGWVWLLVVGVGAGMSARRPGAAGALARRAALVGALGLGLGWLWPVEPLRATAAGLLAAAIGSRWSAETRLQVGAAWLVLGGAATVYGLAQGPAPWAGSANLDADGLRAFVLDQPLALVPWLGLVWIGQWAGQLGVDHDERSRLIAWVGLGLMLGVRLMSEQAATVYPPPAWASLLEGTAPLAVLGATGEALLVLGACVRFGVWLGSPPWIFRPVLAVGRAPLSAWVAQALTLSVAVGALGAWPAVALGWGAALLVSWGWAAWRPGGRGVLEDALARFR